MSIKENTEVQIDFWCLRTLNSTADIANSSPIVGAGVNAMEGNETINLLRSTAADFSTSELEPTRWFKSTTNLDNSSFTTQLATNGKISGTELGTQHAPGSNPTIFAFRINFTVPSGGRFYRLSKTATNATFYDHSFHYDMKVSMTHPSDRKPEHACVLIPAQTFASDSEHNPFHEDQAGLPTPIGMSSGVQFDVVSGKFKVTTAGAYEIHVAAIIRNISGTSGAGLSIFTIKKNGAEDLMSADPAMGNQNNGDFEYTYVLHGIFNLAANDEIEFKINSALTNEQVRIEPGSTLTIEKVA